MRKTKFKIGDFFEYRGSIYKVNEIVFGSYGYVYKVKFIEGDKEDAKTAISGSREEFTTKVSYSRIPLHTSDNADSAKDKELKDLIRLVLKYHAENLAADFHTESEEEYIFKNIKKQWKITK